MKPPKKVDPIKKPVSSKVLNDIIAYSARLIVENQALQDVLEAKRVPKWRDEYDRAFLKRWENQGATFAVLYALVREQRLADTLRNLRAALNKHGVPDE